MKRTEQRTSAVCTFKYTNLFTLFSPQHMTDAKEPTTHMHNKMATHEIMLLYKCSTFANTISLFLTVTKLVMGEAWVEKGEEGSILEEVRTVSWKGCGVR